MKQLQKVFLICWFICGFIGVSYVHRVHSIPVEAGFIDGKNKSKSLSLSHFLSPACKCSHYLKNYLVKRGPSSLVETVYLINDPQQLSFKKEFEQAGFNVMLVDESEVQGVPLLVIKDETGKLIYSGGYTNGRINAQSEFLDLKIANDITSRNILTAYNAIGCAVSDKLKKYIDPVGIKQL